MKKTMYLLFVLAGVVLISCKTDKRHNHKHESHEMAKIEYVCPMECEGQKTYADKDVKCPVCKMKLVAKESESNEENDKDGENHGEKKEHDSDEKH